MAGLLAVASIMTKHLQGQCPKVNALNELNLARVKYTVIRDDCQY